MVNKEKLLEINNCSVICNMEGGFEDGYVNSIKNLLEKMSPIGQLDFMYLGLISHCNLKCFYCYDETFRNKKEDYLSMEEIRNIDIDSKKLGFKYVTLTGGACRVLPYAKEKDATAVFTICQEFYDAVMNGEIDTDKFPIGSVSIDRTEG